jgi:hypothetical protein
MSYETSDNPLYYYVAIKNYDTGHTCWSKSYGLPPLDTLFKAEQVIAQFNDGKMVKIKNRESHTSTVTTFERMWILLNAK